MFLVVLGFFSLQFFFCSKHFPFLFVSFHFCCIGFSLQKNICLFLEQKKIERNKKQDREVSFGVYHPYPDVKREEKCTERETNTKHNKTHFSNIQVYFQRKCTIIFILYLPLSSDIRIMYLYTERRHVKSRLR